jgi:hypothetical protein
MIKFFRKIRQNMIKENKVSRYLLYAIGEILLVVIGILIALQINTWNQNRLANIEERTILKNLHTEFLLNKETLKDALAENSNSFNIGKTLFNLIGKERAEIEKHNIDSLLFNSIETGSFRPSENTISDLLQSGRLQLLNNTNLKDLLHQWARVLKEYDNARDRAEIKVDDELVPYLSKHYSMRDIDMYGRLAWRTKTLLKIDKLQIFEDIEFENILDDFLYRSSSSRNGLDELEKVISVIIKETE